MPAETATVVDAGECDWCSHGQWSHKLGKRGCKELGCPCGKYEPPKSPPAAEPEPAPAESAQDELPAALDLDEHRADDDPAASEPTQRELLAQMTRESIDLGTYELTVPAGVRTASTCAYPNGEDQGEHDHALCEDVVAERDEPAAAELAGQQVDPDAQMLWLRDALGVDVDADLVEAVEWFKRELASTTSSLTSAVADVSRLREELAEERRSRAGAVAQRDEAIKRVDELSTDLTGAHAALTRADGEAEEAQRRAQALAAELDTERARANRLERQLDGAKAGRQHAQATLAETIHASVTAAANVLWRYDAHQCEHCGSRYTEPVTHEHPLTPVTVLVVRREVAG